MLNKLLTTLFLISTSTKANSHEEEKEPIYDFLLPQAIPLYCGNSDKVFATTMMGFKMSMLGFSEVRNNGKVDGELLANISIWFNPKKNNGVILMTFEEYDFGTCLLGYGVNWKFDTEMLLDYVNENLE